MDEDSTAASEPLPRPRARADDFDDDGMRSILAAAIGLTSLGVHPPVLRQYEPEDVTDEPKAPNPKPAKNAPPPERTARSLTLDAPLRTVVDVASAAPPPRPLQAKEPARKKPRTTAAPLKKRQLKAPLDVPAAAAATTGTEPLKTDRLPEPEQLPRFVQRGDCNAMGVGSPAAAPPRGAGLAYPPLPRPLPEYPATNTSAQVQGPEPRPEAPAPPLVAVTSSPAPSFPEILYEILSDPANGDILAWLPHGRGFAIHNRELFASRILAEKFDGAKYTSFTRRLKRWNFDRVPRGPEMGAYYNKYFVRDRPDLVGGMVCGVEQPMECGIQGPADATPSASREEAERDREFERVQARRMEAEAVARAAAEVRREVAARIAEAGGGKYEAAAGPGGAAREDAAVEAAMEVHRRKLQQQQQKQQPQLTKESKNSRPGTKRQQKKQEHQTRSEVPPLRQGPSLSPENAPTPYNPGDYNPTDVPLIRHLGAMQARIQALNLNHRQLGGPRRQSSEGSGQSFASLPGRREAAAQSTSQRGHQGLSNPSRKRKERPALPQISSFPDMRRQPQRAPRDPRELASALTARRITDASFDRNALFAQLSVVSPEDEQRQHLDGVGLQVLSGLPYPALPTMSSSSPLYVDPSLAGNDAMNDRLNFHRDRMVLSMLDQDMVSDATLQRNSQAFLPNQGINHEMMTRILVGNKTHKEIMMMAARDLQSRASGGGGQSAGAPQPHLRPSLPRVQPPTLLQDRMPPLQRIPPQPRRPLLRLPVSPGTRPQHPGNLPSHAAMLRELEERVEKEMAVAEAASIAADQAAAAVASWDEARGGGRRPPLQRRNSRASAA